MKRQGVRNWRQSSDKHKEVRKEAKVEDDGCFGHGECKVTLQLNVEVCYRMNAMYQINMKMVFIRNATHQKTE